MARYPPYFKSRFTRTIARVCEASLQVQPSHEILTKYIVHDAKQGALSHFAERAGSGLQAAPQQQGASRAGFPFVGARLSFSLSFSVARVQKKEKKTPVEAAGQNMGNRRCRPLRPAGLAWDFWCHLVFCTAPSRIRGTFPFSQSLKTRQERSN